MNLDDFQQNNEGTLSMLVPDGSALPVSEQPRVRSGRPLAVGHFSDGRAALLLKYNEFYPVLSTGADLSSGPPVDTGSRHGRGTVDDQSGLIIPRISHQLQSSHGSSASDGRFFDPQYDTRPGSLCRGRISFPINGRSRNRCSSCLLRISCETTNRAAWRDGDLLPRQGKRPAVWLLKNASQTLDLAKLTPAGQKVIVPHRNGTDIFLAIGLTFDQLQNRATGYRYLSTWDLVRRIQYPTAHASSTRAQIMHLHSRITRPVVSLMSVSCDPADPAERERQSGRQYSDVYADTALVLGLGYGMEFLARHRWYGPKWRPGPRSCSAGRSRRG